MSILSLKEAALAAHAETQRAANGEPAVVRFRPMDGDAMPEPAEDDPFMPPDEVWRWLPDAKCVAVDANGQGFWYDREITPSEDQWIVLYGGLEAEVGYFGVRDLGDTDWRTTKRTRPAHL